MFAVLSVSASESKTPDLTQSNSQNPLPAQPLVATDTNAKLPADKQPKPKDQTAAAKPTCPQPTSKPDNAVLQPPLTVAKNEARKHR